ncbi:hypothetical protein KFK09_016984 [Dendrobium nobile]|uniref:Uncharacterized protein n=1 Tax=Dendrobium nobile TaxID=94219 RepID=A0A8T3B083_DENNO|nr:hypothetical protein KFK09_016984 [Dendrobium nobile]
MTIGGRRVGSNGWTDGVLWAQFGNSLVSDFGDVRAFGWFSFEFFFRWFHDFMGFAHGEEANVCTRLMVLFWALGFAGDFGEYVLPLESKNKLYLCNFIRLLIKY